MKDLIAILDECLEKIHKGTDYSKEKDNRVLVFDRMLLIRAYRILKEGKPFGDWSLEDVIKEYRSLIEEMDKRGLKHDYVEGLDKPKKSIKERVRELFENKARCEDKEDDKEKENDLHSYLDFAELREKSDEELLAIVKDLHKFYKQIVMGKNKKPEGLTKEDILNINIFVTEILKKRKAKVPFFDDELDRDTRRFKEREYSVINPSGKVSGKEITLEEVLPHFKSFKFRYPFIYLVGGLVNNGKSQNDIDILIKASENDFSPRIKHILKWRILRALPEHLRKRVEFHWDKYSGPFTPHIELFDWSFNSINPDDVIMMSFDNMDNKDVLDKTLEMYKDGLDENTEYNLEKEILKRNLEPEREEIENTLFDINNKNYDLSKLSESEVLSLHTLLHKMESE